jgi:hypothetical protein
MTRVFISYSRKDLVFVERLSGDLKTAGLEVWYDLSGLEGGTRWGREIQNAIQQSEIFIVVLSPNSVESEWVEKEFMYANSQKRKVIPLLYQPCETPMWFINLHFIDVQGENYARNFWIILKAMGIQPGDAAAQEKPAAAALEIPAQHEAPAALPERKPPGKRNSSKAPKTRLAWVLGLVGLAAVIALAVWGMPALAARLAPAPTATATAPLTATATLTETATATASSTPTQTLVPSPTFTSMPTNEPTTGSVSGYVGWGFQPVEGVIVDLCTHWVYTCQGTKFSGVTNAEGLFIMKGVSPGDYELITKYPGQVDESRMSGQGGWPASIQVAAGQTVKVDNISICKNDLEIYAPTIKGNTVTFIWKAYPGATSYDGYLTGRDSWHTSSTLYSLNLESGSYQLLLDVKTKNLTCVHGYINFTVP